MVNKRKIRYDKIIKRKVKCVCHFVPPVLLFPLFLEVVFVSQQKPLSQSQNFGIGLLIHPRPISNLKPPLGAIIQLL